MVSFGTLMLFNCKQFEELTKSVKVNFDSNGYLLISTNFINIGKIPMCSGLVGVKLMLVWLFWVVKSSALSKRIFCI